MSPNRNAVSLLLAVTLLTSGMALAAPGGTPDAAAAQAVTSSVLFIENAGQWPAEARFQVWGSPLGAGTTWLAEEAIWISWVDGGDPSPDSFERGMPPGVEVPVSKRAHGVNLKLSFVGANPHPRLEPADPVDTTVSYFLGNDSARWRPAVPVWHRVRYVDLYPDVDLEISSAGGTIVQRLWAHPGANTASIALQIEGAAVAGVEGRTVHLATSMGQLALPLPTADFPLIVTEETTPGQARTWTAAPASGNSTTAALQPVVATDDPADLLYSTFVGGNLGEGEAAIVIDGTGHAYVSGSTGSSNFPTTPGAFDPGFNGSCDAFVIKLTPTGSSLRYATFLGGSYDDYASGIQVDGTGAAYVMGSTNSSNFPTTLGAFDAGYNGSTDVFVVKLNQVGSRLIYATYLGGTGSDNGESIAIDGQGNAHAVGWTGSGDFPATPGTFAPSLNGQNDAFVVKLNSTGSNLMYGTFLGGNYNDIGRDIAVDSAGRAYVTGTTSSSDFPFTPSAFDPSYNGINDAFIVKLNPEGSQLVYATFLGTRLDDSGLAIALDGTGGTYVIGWTFSNNFPTTSGAYDRTHNGSSDTFVLKLNPAGSSLDYSTFLGGGDEDIGDAIMVDTTGQAFVTGLTRSNNFPTTPGAYDTSHNGGGTDVFVVRLNPAGSQLVYGTFVGSPGQESGEGIVVDGTGRVCVTGWTEAREFPSTPLSFDPTHNGGTDAFVLKLDTTPYVPNIIAPIEQPAAGAIISGAVSLSGFAIDLGSSTGTGVDGVHIYLDGPHGTGILIGAASYGLNRPDVAAQYGTRFGPSGWERTWDATGVVPGIHWLHLYAHRTTVNAWTTMPGHPVVVAGGHAVWLPFAPAHE